MRKALKELTSCQQHWVAPGWCRTHTFIMDEWVAKVTKRFQPNIHQRDAHVIGVQGSMLHEPVCLRMGEGVAKWSSARLVIDRSQILVQAGECSPRSTFWADSYFGSIRSTPVLQQQHVKGPCHSAKGASGRLQLNTHVLHICGFAWGDIVNSCMVVWCTQNVHQNGSSFTWHQSSNNQTAPVSRPLVFKTAL